MFEASPDISCHIVPFPLTKRLGRIREVADKLMRKQTDRLADAYRHQVADTLFRHLARIGLSENDQDEQVGAFFVAVELEMSRLFDQAEGSESSTI